MGAETFNYQLLLPDIEKMLRELCTFLHTYDVYTHKFSFYFQHQHNIPSRADVGLRQALRDSEHFLELIRTKMEYISFPAPVISIKLVVSKFHDYTTSSNDLFSKAGGTTNRGSIETLLEQLSARLGTHRAVGLRTHADHRPEHAHRFVGAGESSSSGGGKVLRPFWLLEKPERLYREKNRLYYKGLIKFLKGPERLESGWWDGEDIQRDYYIATDTLAGNLWIYNDLGDRRKWYLHGLFG